MFDAVESVLAERRGRSLARLRTVGLVGAVVFHAALATAAVIVPNLGDEEREPLEFVNVQVVPAAALGQRRPPTPEPEPPPPEPEPEIEEPEPEEPEPEPEVAEPEPAAADPAPVLPVPSDDAPPPEERKPEPRRPPTAPETPAGSPQGSVQGSSTLGSVTVGDPTFTYGYYLDRVLASIEAQWRRPPTDSPLEVVLRFRIGRDGRVSELDVDVPSGLNAFDLAGLRAVQSASPLPPLPAGYRKDSLSVRLIVR
ncbi:MAG TPA: energy transducer TonB [Thermoanaerobaculia bacterium]|nr:energy transducer TonB [Thermoanaerobaculia bacterium]